MRRRNDLPATPLAAHGSSRTDAGKVLAVVVSFNGQSKTVETVRALMGQVDHVHVVDNASGEGSWNHLQTLRHLPALSIERLPRNEGIGRALNIGLAKARELGCGWLLTMDQDSLAEPSMVGAYRRAIERHTDVACLTPNVYRNGIERRLPDARVAFAISSGNLIRLDVFTRVGDFDEELFIDGVDLDFSLRARGAGYSILRVGDAVLRHELGDQHRVRGLLSRFYLAHSPLRHYYMYRNHLYLMRRYWSRFPLFIAKLTLFQIGHLLAILVYERDRTSSMRFIRLGVGDFFRGRTGPCSTLA